MKQKNRFDKIILNIPHDSHVFPMGSRSEWKGLSESDIEKWTDSYTYYLFDSRLDGIDRVVFPYSRFYCDVERLENDPLEKEGRGIIYTKFNDAVRAPVTDEEREEIMWLYNDHKKKVLDLIDSDRCLVIDCHSFPNDLSDVDICIGFNDDWSKPDQEVIDLICDYFTNHGYKVGINEPFSNSYSPESEHKYKSVMIEVNKRVYLSKDGGLDGFFYKKNALIQRLYMKLLDI